MKKANKVYKQYASKIFQPNTQYDIVGNTITPPTQEEVILDLQTTLKFVILQAFEGSKIEPHGAIVTDLDEIQCEIRRNQSPIGTLRYSQGNTTVLSYCEHSNHIFNPGDSLSIVCLKNESGANVEWSIVSHITK